MTLNTLKSSSQLQRERWSKNIFIFGIVAILFLTLLPFDFEKPQDNYLRAIVTGFGHHSDRSDLAGNLLLFLPFGFGLAGIVEKKRWKFWQASILSIFSSFALSLTVEVLQIFLPERASTSIDLISNTLSGFLGFSIFAFGKDFIFNCAIWLLQIGKRWLNFKLAIALFLSYLISICFLLFSFREATQLSNWDGSYPLLVGNELTADRAWKGQVAQFCIADRAASPTEIDRLLTDIHSCNALESSLVALYEFAGNRDRYADRMQNLPNLVAQGTQPKKTREQSVLLNYKHWLQTTDSVKLLTDRMTATSQLTIVITLATLDINQTGPARIISLSKNPVSRNFTLGQEGNDLSFRLRTPLTGGNGDAPESIIPNLLSDTEFHRIAITYDGWTVRLYADRADREYQIQFSPDAALFWSVMTMFDKKIHLNPWSMWVYQCFYLGIIFVPLGLLFAIAWVSYRGRFLFFLFAILGGIVLPAFLVEGTIASCMERGIQLDRIGLSMAIEILAILISQNGFSAWLRSN